VSTTLEAGVCLCPLAFDNAELRITADTPGWCLPALHFYVTRSDAFEQLCRARVLLCADVTDHVFGGAFTHTIPLAHDGLSMPYSTARAYTALIASSVFR